MKYNCEICKDDGRCLNNINSPNFNNDRDIYDCCDYVNPMWMKEWYKSLQNKTDEVYVSSFVRWSRNYS